VLFLSDVFILAHGSNVNKDMRIDWDRVDSLIRQYLPNMTCVKFCKEYAPETIARTIGQRAKKLGITSRKYVPTEEHKQKTKEGATKKLDDKVFEYVRQFANKKSRIEIAKDLGISFHLVNRAMSDLGIVIDEEKSKEFQAEGSRGHVKKAAEAFWEKYRSNPDFAASMSAKTSANSKRLWQDELYRAKVSGGIRRTYDTTDFRERLSIIGQKRYNEDPAVRAILASDRPFKNSKLNDTVAIKLESLGLVFQREFELINYKFDFKVGNILLEVHGNYWHNLPENKKNDLAKATIINTYYPQYKLCVIWESEIKSIRCNERLVEVLGLKTIIPVEIELDKLEFIDKPSGLDKFLISFHYLGTTNRKKYQFGMLLFNNLVAVATFGQPVRPNTAVGKVLELTRLCRHPKFHNKNLLSFFLAKCVNYIKNLGVYDNLVSFADLRLHDGTIYRATNWTDMGDTAPDYNYMSADNIPMHKKTLYNRAVAADMTEGQYATVNNLHKVSIGCKRKFLLSLV